MEFKFIKASKARKLHNLYEYGVAGNPFDELRNNISGGIRQKAQIGGTSYIINLDDELSCAGIFVDSRTGQRDFLHYIIEDIESAGFFVDAEAREDEGPVYLRICW